MANNSAKDLATVGFFLAKFCWSLGFCSFQETGIFYIQLDASAFVLE